MPVTVSMTIKVWPPISNTFPKV